MFALCNAGEALVAGWLIERYFGSGFSLDRLSHVLGLLTAAILATTISGIGGTAGFLYFHNSTAPILSTWQHWFASDALGILTIAPLIIELAATGREPPSRTELIEGITGLVALAGASAAVILLPQGHSFLLPHACPRTHDIPDAPGFQLSDGQSHWYCQ